MVIEKPKLVLRATRIVSESHFRYSKAGRAGERGRISWAISPGYRFTVARLEKCVIRVYVGSLTGVCLVSLRGTVRRRECAFTGRDKYSQRHTVECALNEPSVSATCQLSQPASAHNGGSFDIDRILFTDSQLLSIRGSCVVHRALYPLGNSPSYFQPRSHDGRCIFSCVIVARYPLVRT